MTGKRCAPPGSEAASAKRARQAGPKCAKGSENRGAGKAAPSGPPKCLAAEYSDPFQACLRQMAAAVERAALARGRAREAWQRAARGGEQGPSDESPMEPLFSDFDQKAQHAPGGGSRDGLGAALSAQEEARQAFERVASCAHELALESWNAAQSLAVAGASARAAAPAPRQPTDPPQQPAKSAAPASAPPSASSLVFGVPSGLTPKAQPGKAAPVASTAPATQPAAAAVARPPAAAEPGRRKRVSWLARKVMALRGAVTMVPRADVPDVL